MRSVVSHNWANCNHKGNIMKKRIGCWLSGLILLACSVTTANAQSTFGSITGTVTDQSGAVVPAARITVTNQDTVTNLLPGTYRSTGVTPLLPDYGLC